MSQIYEEVKTPFKSFVVDDPKRRLGARFVMYYNAKQKGGMDWGQGLNGVNPWTRLCDLLGIITHNS